MHTNPHCWEEPRIFQTNEHDTYEVHISTVDTDLPKPATPSPNKAYAFHLAEGTWDETAQRWRREILVAIERPYLLKLEFPDVRDMNDVRWINERLLFVRAWRGRIAASDIIINVETGSVVHQEPAIWGGDAYEQSKICDQPEWTDSDACQCDE